MFNRKLESTSVSLVVIRTEINNVKAFTLLLIPVLFTWFVWFLYVSLFQSAMTWCFPSFLYAFVACVFKEPGIFNHRICGTSHGRPPGQRDLEGCGGGSKAGNPKSGGTWAAEILGIWTGIYWSNMVQSLAIIIGICWGNRWYYAKKRVSHMIFTLW